jgi:hypothetical protein
MKRKLRIKAGQWPAFKITREAFRASELVYIATANKAIRYDHDDSRIAYIGTTKNGAARIASSAVWKGGDILAKWGIRDLEFYVVTCPSSGKYSTAKRLERALLIRFREKFGRIPLANDQGRKLRWNDELDFFTIQALDDTIACYSNW